MASQDWLEKDFYAVLGVPKDVSDAELKKVYRKLARQNHPDSNPGDAAAEARFKEISEAYSVLSDEATRREYDQLRALGAGGARFAPGGNGAGSFEDLLGDLFANRARASGRGGEYDDIFGGLFGAGAGPAGGYGGYGGFAPRGPVRGADYTASTTLDFLTAINGETVRLQGPSGKPINVKIPAGVADGQRIKLRGKGQPSPNGGEPGDLVLTVTVKPHPVFTRDGNDLRVTVPVSFAEAALGATIEVPTLGGERVKVKVPPGTPNGRILRVRDRVRTAKGTGDLLVELEVAVPSRLSAKSADALRAFVATLPDESPRAGLYQRASGR